MVNDLRVFSFFKKSISISPVCDVKNSNKAFHQLVTNWQIWGSFLLKIKIKQKQKLDNFKEIIKSI